MTRNREPITCTWTSKSMSHTINCPFIGPLILYIRLYCGRIHLSHSNSVLFSSCRENSRNLYDAQVLRRPKMIKRGSLLFCRIDKASSENWDISFWTVLFLPWILFLTNIRYNEVKWFVHFTNSKPCCTTRPAITGIPVRLYERLGCTLNDMVYELCLG